MTYESNGHQVNPYIETHRAGPFTNNPKIQPHEESQVKADREIAATLGYNERDTEAFVKKRLMLRRQEQYIRQSERLAIGERMAAVAAVKIPAEYRTRAMSKREAAKYLGRPNPDSGVRWLNKCIEDGTISCESLSPQSHVFDRRQFPDNTQANILPK